MAKEAAVTPPVVDPIKDMATAAWAASQAAQNPRLAAGHPNANPLRRAYVEDDDGESLHEVSCGLQSRSLVQPLTLIAS